MKIKTTTPNSKVRIVFLDDNLSMTMAVNKHGHFEVTIPKDVPIAVIATAQNAQNYFSAIQTFSEKIPKELQLSLKETSVEKIRKSLSSI